MTVTVNQVELKSLQQLPENIQSIVQLIPDAGLWLELMMNKAEVTIAFSSTAEFVKELAIGLRNTSLVLLQKADITLDTHKLLTLNANELRDLVLVERKSEPGLFPGFSAQLDLLTKKHGILKNSDFETNRRFLQDNNINGPGFIWSASFSEQIDFFQILTYSSQAWQVDEFATGEAIRWAQSQAQNLREFAHYYCLHLGWQQKQAAATTNLDEMLSQIKGTLLTALDSPVVTFELDKYSLNLAITQWQDAGNLLGFATFSSALLNAVLNMPLGQNADPKIEVQQYLQQLQTLLKSTLSTNGYINQAGTCRHYQIDLGNRDILLNVDNQGCLSVALDLPKPSAFNH